MYTVCTCILQGAMCNTYPPGGSGGRLGGVGLLVTRALTAWMMASL